jgi:hypothetical protein
MGESNCHDSHTLACRKDVKKLEEKFDGFELHHILWQDNEVAVTPEASLRGPRILKLYI